MTAGTDSGPVRVRVDTTRSVAARNTEQEQQRAARALLRTPLITSSNDPDTLTLVHRHAAALTELFRRFAGYRLLIEPTFARLYKAGLGVGHGRPRLTSSGRPFTPRTYAYYALTLSALQTAPEQMLLSALVSSVRAAAAEAGLELGPTDAPAEKRALGQALRALLDDGVLREVDGTVNADEALLDIDSGLARALYAPPTSPAETAETAEDIIYGAAHPRLGGTRTAVRRRLLEHPVVYYDELTDAERFYLTNQRKREAQNIENAFGLELEIRLEGVAAVTADSHNDNVSDLLFPGTGVEARAALLIVDELLSRHRPLGAGSRLSSARGGFSSLRLIVGVRLEAGEIRNALDAVIEQYPTGWGTALDNLDRLAADATTLLVQMNLIARPGAVDPDHGGPPAAHSRARYDSSDPADTAWSAPGERTMDVRGVRGQYPDTDDAPPPAATEEPATGDELPGEADPAHDSGWVLLAAAARWSAHVTTEPA